MTPRESYQEFLRSAFWKNVSAAVRRRARFRCELCNSCQGIQVHHKTYENHGNEDKHLEDLICLCAECHGRFHDKLGRGIPVVCAGRPRVGPDPLLQKTLELLYAYATEHGGVLEDMKRPRLRIAKDLGISIKRVTGILRALDGQEFIKGGYGGDLKLRTKRWPR